MAGKKVRIMLCITVTALCLAGCQGNKTAETQESTKTEAVSDIATQEGTNETQAEDGSITGQVTAVNGQEITIALGTMPERPEGETGDMQTPPERPEGETGDMQTPPERPEGETGDMQTPPERPEGETGDMQTPPEMPDGKNGKMRGLELTGEEKTITVSDSTTFTLDERGQSSEGSLEDIEEGSILKVVMDGDQVASVTIIRMGKGGMGAPGQGSAEGSVELEGSYTVDGTQENGEAAYDSTQADQNTVLVKNGGSLKLTGGTLSKTGDSTSEEDSNFYGLNAVMAVAKGSTAEISDVEITSDAEGSNAIFATGEEAQITVKDVTIHTKGASSRGLDATYGGTITAENVNITTEGAHCAPLATDRGEGTITLTSGTVSAAGDGSPCIYSTGNITAVDVTGTATGSQAAVVEGKNSITLDNCKLTGAGENGVMLYQSTSGDAAEGTAVFTCKNSVLSTTSDGPMFYVTNTDAKAEISNSALKFDSGILAKVSGNNTNNWGKEGANGGNFVFTASEQNLEGDILCDEISTVSLELKDASSYKGAVDAEHTGKEVQVSLDETSQWELSGDSYVTVLTDSKEDCSNILSNGYCLYYDTDNTANAWLNGQTVSLSGGGELKPADVQE